jgi:hypothetical protein
MGKLMIIGVVLVGSVAAVLAKTPASDTGVAAAARALIAAEKAMPRCSEVLGDVLSVTAGKLP